MIDLHADRTGLAGGVHVQDVVTGTEDADTLYGGDGDDTVSGLGGDDFIFTGHGLDSVDGGDGDDAIFLGDQGDTVHGGAGADYIDVTTQFTLSGATGTYAGDAGDDQLKISGIDPAGFNGVTLQGGDGADRLFDISAGDDLLDGGADFDTVVFQRVPRSITVDLGAGTSEGKFIGSNTLVSIEGIIGSRAADVFTGSSVANTMLGRNGTDLLSGMAGDDTLFGNGRADTITGGLGGDSLTGGGGHDVFVYESIADSPTAHSDLINGFKKHDVIDLSAIDADVNTAGDQAFVRVKAFDGHAGQMTMSFSGGVTSLQVDVDGDAVADMTIRINGYQLTHHDFVL